MVRNALRNLVIGASSVSCLAYVTNSLYAEGETEKNLINIRRDTISSIPDNPFKGNKNEESFLSLVQATRAARDLVQQTMTTNGYPGIVIGVSIKGETCWVQGFGFSNIETGTRCNKNTVMRIASISKPITIAGVAKLYEQGKVDLDKNIYEYLGNKFPEKKIDDKKVAITIRQLASHTGGIRHYRQNETLDLNLLKLYTNSVDALETFAKDDLITTPGTKFEYSTFGYTLLSAAVEMAVPEIKSFGHYIVNDICRKSLGMNNTYLDENTPVIMNRSKQYIHSSAKVSENAKNVECSYKYAGGGLLSTVPDLLRFGNAMMYSYLPNPPNVKTFLKKSTVDMLWTPAPFGMIKINPNLAEWTQYGLGWGLIRNANPSFVSGSCPPFKDIIFHTGGATGGTTLLMVIPEKEMVVALMINLESAKGMGDLGLTVAELFKDVKMPLTGITSNPKEIMAKE